MAKELTLHEKMKHIQEEGGSLKINFENGSKLIQNIGKKVFFTERDKQRAPLEILEIFKGIAHDMGAVSFELQT